MNSIQQYQVALAVSLIIFSLNGCNPLPPEGIKSLPPIPPTPAATAPTAKAKPIATTVTTKPTKPTANTKPTKPTVATKPTTLTVKRKSESFDPQKTSAFKPVAIPDSVTVTIYEVDSQCQALIPQKVPVKKEHSIESAVSKVLEKQHNSDFDVSYRVILDRSERLATIDLRIPANSRRQLVSLSSCEQLALFGSLRQTLTSNRGWEIQKVRFTEEGKEIWL